MGEINTSENLAFVLSCLNSSKNREYFGKTIVQKMIYFIQNLFPECGFHFDYKLHYFGPYSYALDRELDEMEIDGFLSIEPRSSGKGYIIKIEEQGKIIKDEAENTEIDRIVKQFENDGPAALELKATLYFLWDKMFKKGNPVKIKADLIKEAKIVKPNFTDDSFERCFSWLVEKGIMK